MPIRPGALASESYVPLTSPPDEPPPSRYRASPARRCFHRLSLVANRTVMTREKIARDRVRRGVCPTCPDQPVRCYEAPRGPMAALGRRMPLIVEGMVWDRACPRCRGPAPWDGNEESARRRRRRGRNHQHTADCLDESKLTTAALCPGSSSSNFSCDPTVNGDDARVCRPKYRVRLGAFLKPRGGKGESSCLGAFLGPRPTKDPAEQENAHPASTDEENNDVAGLLLQLGGAARKSCPKPSDRKGKGFVPDPDIENRVDAILSKAEQNHHQQYQYKRAIGRYSAALGLLSQAGYPSYHPLVSETMRKLNDCCRAQSSLLKSADMVKVGIEHENGGEFDVALETYKAAYHVRRDALGESHTSLPMLLNMIQLVQAKRDERLGAVPLSDNDSGCNNTIVQDFERPHGDAEKGSGTHRDDDKDGRDNTTNAIETEAKSRGSDASFTNATPSDASAVRLTEMKEHIEDLLEQYEGGVAGACPVEVITGAMLDEPDFALQQYCIAKLFALATKCPKAKGKIIKTGALAAVVHGMAEALHCPRVQRQGCELLRVLAEKGGGRFFIVKAGGCDRIAHTLSQHMGSEVLVLAALGAVAPLGAHRAGRAAFRHMDTSAAVVTAMRVHIASGRVQSAACRALRHLSVGCGSSSHEELEVVVLAMHAHPTNLEVQKQACLALNVYTSSIINVERLRRCVPAQEALEGAANDFPQCVADAAAILDRLNQ